APPHADYCPVATGHRPLATGHSSEVPSDEADDLPAVEVDPGALAARVVAAGEPGHVERDSERPDARDHVAREVCGEGQVVARGDEAHRSPALPRQAFGERHGADGQPR